MRARPSFPSDSSLSDTVSAKVVQPRSESLMSTLDPVLVPPENGQGRKSFKFFGTLHHFQSLVKQEKEKAAKRRVYLRTTHKCRPRQRAINCLVLPCGSIEKNIRKICSTDFFGKKERCESADKIAQKGFIRAVFSIKSSEKALQ